MHIIVGYVPGGSTDIIALLLALSSDAINATLYKNLNFNFIRDITPVADIPACPT